MKQNQTLAGGTETERVLAGTHLTETAQRIARRPWPATPLRPGVRVSFELFPPASPKGETSLDTCVSSLAPFGPRFVSVTYGAGGSTQDRTQRTIERVASSTALPVAGHLTCVGATQAEVAEVVDGYFAAGVRHIVALRGDAPAGSDGGVVEGGYQTAVDLVGGLRHHGERHQVPLEISVAAYPEVHPKAASPQADLDNLKRKLDAGADQAITQYFFDTDVFLRFLEQARAAGITAPIVPGIMPVDNFANLCRFSERCGARIPEWMHQLFDGLDEAPEIRRMVAATIAAEQCRRLAEHGVTDFHFYTMNKPELSAATCRILGLTPAAAEIHNQERAS